MMACAAARKYTEQALTSAYASAVEIRARVGFWTIDTVSEVLTELLASGKCSAIVRNDMHFYRLPSGE